jgi:hypothetical protein
MSTLSMVSDNEAETPKVPPSEVGSLLMSWWLTIGFSLLALIAVLPMAPKPLVDGGTITRIGWLTYIGLGLVLLVGGLILGAGIRSAKGSALGMCKLGLLIAVVLVVGSVAAVLVLAAGDKSAGGATLLLGPTPLLAIILLAFVVILPVFFAILAFSFAGSQAVREWFNPPQEEPVSYAAEETAGGAWEGATAEGGAAVAEVGEEVAVEEAPAERHETPAAEHFEDVMEQELAAAEQETVAYHPAPPTEQAGGKPTMIARSDELAAEAEEMPEALAETSGELPAADVEASDITDGGQEEANRQREE